jgi:phage baseplate assembly protein V
MSQSRIGELERRLSNIVRPGTIVEADYAQARVRVKIGDNTSTWLPWITQRAGKDCTWHPPEIGEQVLVISPSGELAAGFVLPGGIYKKDRPANGDKASISRTTYADGAVSEYDRETHIHSLKIPQAGKSIIQVGENATSEVTSSTITHEFGNNKVIISESGISITSGSTALNISSNGITINGPITQSGGDIVSNLISLQTHKHSGVTSGTSITTPPIL